jgi:DNA-binding transcriptional ArsR family regulator
MTTDWCSTRRLTNPGPPGIVNQVVEDAMSGDEGRLSRTFAALADPTRRDLVARLAAGDATLTELAAAYDVSVQAVAKHLKVLEQAGLVRRTKDAQRRPCHLEADVLDLMTGWIERRRREAEERYQRLDALLERMDDREGAAPRAGEGKAS